ncbi:golgin subfamily A member 6-like protein 2 [Cardiocondyla obscurior]|uniref:golgin subfamily A member 6-like protein 2 n=1 Tax=Cardiocondyla obscurior TaxID=286306 RepID=UPI0039655DE6
MSEQEKEIVESGSEERKEEKGEEKIKKKMGRPAKVELLKRERANSLPILKAWKQGEKRKERQEEKGEIEGLEGFRKSVKVYRSPVKATGEGGEGGISKEGFEEVIKEMRSGFARIQAQMEEVRKIKVQIRKEMEDLKKIWKKEKIDLEKRIDGMKKKIREKKYEGGKLEIPEEIQGKVLSLEEKTRMLEMAKEKEKKEWRKNNLIIRGIKIKSEEKKALKEQVGEIIEATGVKAKIEDVNKIGGVNKGGYGMVWREADRLKREGKQVKIGYKKIWVNKEMWIWDDLKEELRKWDGGRREGNELEKVERKDEEGGKEKDEEKNGKRKDKRQKEKEKEKKERGKEKEEVKDRNVRIVFWNVAGIENKDEDFWKNMEKWEVIYMCETWLEEKKWKRLRSKLPKGYKWINKGAEKQNKKGRAMGGMVMGWREDLEGEEELEFEDRKGMIGIKIKSGKVWWKIAGEMLGGVEWRVREEIGGERIEDNEEDINREEFENVIRKLKKGKAAGSDGLENEIW